MIIMIVIMILYKDINIILYKYYYKEKKQQHETLIDKLYKLYKE